MGVATTVLLLLGAVWISSDIVVPMRRSLKPINRAAQLIADLLMTTTAQDFFSRTQGHFCVGTRPDPSLAPLLVLQMQASLPPSFGGVVSTVIPEALVCPIGPSLCLQMGLERNNIGKHKGNTREIYARDRRLAAPVARRKKKKKKCSLFKRYIKS